MPSRSTLFTLCAATVLVPVLLVPSALAQPGHVGPDLVRAGEGEAVAVMLTPVRADKREQFEAFIRDFQATLATNIEEGRSRPGDREAYERTRFLTPTEANEDGTYTYAILADPYVPEVNYSMLDALRLRYDEAEAERRYRLFQDALAGPQQVLLLRQSKR